MSTSSFNPAAHARDMRAKGFWLDRTYDEVLRAALAAAPDKTAVVAYRADRPQPLRLSYRELADHVAHAAAALRALGVGPGDVVAVQLPNWWEFEVLTLAANRLGAICNPLMPIFREREMAFMLGFAEAKVLVVPKVYAGFDHAAMARALQKDLPALRHVFVVDETGPEGFEALISGVSGRVEAEAGVLRPDDVAVLMFTSGTTGSPKGVTHSANTLLACNRALAGRFGLTDQDVLLGCSPLGHMMGFAAVMLQALYLRGTVVLQDAWNKQRGVDIMAREGVTYTGAATPFLVDIMEAVSAGSPRPQALRSFLCGGAPIPPVHIERAARELSLMVCSLWGMTESLSSTLTEPERAHEKSSRTDGRALEGVEVKVIGEDGALLPNGQTGRLMVRGAQMFLGYYKRPDVPTFDAEGWFDTGDLAYMDDEGYIRINGRTKDVLIRGGENVPVVEIENLLFKHPSVLEAALVGVPDARLGERGCACVVLRPGQAFDLAALQAYMAECKVAKQYWPERVEVMAALPRTPSGKIQKFKLREFAAEPPKAS